MRKIVMTLLALSLAGCATNGQIDYGKTALLVTGVLVVGAIAANSGGSDAGGTDCFIVVTPGGSDTICR